MGKHIVYTKITPLPSNVPRELALDLLHSHEEVIRMNPLVTEVKSCEAPRTAAADEFFSSWYEITEIITWGFGIKKKISFKGVFHDQPWGMQSHIFAPMGTDMRQTYRIGGNQPGEPREPRELGLDTPLDGLYLREEINITCSTSLVAGFVKKEMKDSSKVMIDRIARKAELLDEGKLHAMFENGKLKTSKPSSEPTYSDRPMPSPGSPPGSPPPTSTSDTFSTAQFRSPALDSKGFGKYYDITPGRTTSVRSSQQYLPSYQQPGYQGPESAKPGAEVGAPQQNFVIELPGSFYQQPNDLYPQPLKPVLQQQAFRAELMGDTGTYQPPVQGQDAKPAPPAATHPAYQRSPQPSPGLPSSQLSPQPSPALPTSQRSSQPSPALPTSQRSPQPSPGLPTGQSLPSRHSSSSSYQVTNPDQPASLRNSSYNSNVEQWRRSVQNDQPIDDSYYRNSRATGHSNQIEPDHQRFSKLSFQQSADDLPNTQARVSKCPVCGMFEGDEAAVSHHVSKAHFQ